MALEQLYKQALKGLPIVGTPSKVAAQFKNENDLMVASERLVTMYTSLGGASGLLLGAPGFLFLPLTLPSDIASMLLLQLHMCAAIAALGGLDPEHEEVRERCLQCVRQKVLQDDTNSEESELRSRFGVKIAERGVRLLLGRTAQHAVRGLPFLGGLMSASTNILTTQKVGYCARRRFLNRQLTVTPKAIEMDESPDT